MNKGLIYTFFNYHKASSKLLYETELPGWDKKFIPNRISANKLLNCIQDYSFVIGIADHNKRAVKSRFDTKYVNKYGKRVVVADGKAEYDSNLNSNLPENFYHFSGTTNGPCNRSAFLIMDKINSEKLNCKFGFFHLKKSFTCKELKNLLETVL